MTMSVSLVETTRPEALTTAATQIGGKVAQLNSTIDAQCNALRDLRGGWQGAAADAALAKGQRDLAKQTGLRDRLTQAQQVLQAGGTHLAQARAAILGIVNSLRGQGWQVSDSGIATPPMNLSPVFKSTAAAWTAIVQKLLRTFGQIDAQTASNLPKFSPLSTDEPLTVGEDDDEKTPEEIGAQDSQALQNDELTQEQRDRLVNNTTLTPDQQAALDSGTLTLPPDQMSYLQGFSRAFGDKTPAEIKAVMDKAGSDGGRVADAFQIASNPNITTGGKHALPDGIRRVLDGPALTQPYTEGVFQDGRWLVPPEPTGPLQPTPGLNDLADIVQRGNRELQVGTALDSGLMTKSQEMLGQSNQSPIPQAPGAGSDPLQDGPRWYHENVDPTLQNMFNALNKDDMVVHGAVTGVGAGDFLDNLTRHQWQDDGLAAGGLFDWVGESAANDTTGRAADTAHALAEYTSGHSNQLLNLPGTDSQSLGQVNPELTRDWARAFSPYLDDMVGHDLAGSNGEFAPLNAADEQPLKTRALMSVMYSDHDASAIVFNQAGANIEQYIETAATSITDQDPTSDNSAMRAAGKLQSALDLGSFDESYDRLKNAQDAVSESYNRRSDLYDIASGKVTDHPALTPVEVLSTYLKDVIIGPPPPEDSMTPTASPRNDFPVQVKLAEELINHDVGNAELRSWLQEKLGGSEHFNVPSSMDDERVYNLFYDKLTSYITEVAGADKLMDTYWETYSSAYLNAPPQTGGN